MNDEILFGDGQSPGESVNSQLQTTHFAKALLMVLDETFENVQGYFLDRGTSIFETLSTITAEEASIPVGGKCATLAAQVKHVAFYLDVLERFVRTGENQQVNWDEIWRTTRDVTPGEWEALKTDLRQSYDRTKVMIQEFKAWSSEREIGGAIAMIAHNAYHLGEIRQALCMLKK